MNKTLVSITLTILIILLIGGLIFYKSQKLELPNPVYIDSTNQPKIGNGKINIVVFEDMKCGNCKQYNQSIYPYIQSHYINTNKATYTLIPLAFIQHSMPAANAALCVYHQKENLFFSYVDYLYQHQPNEALDWATPETLIRFAQSIPGIDIEKLETCIKENTYYTQLEQNLNLAAKLMNGQVQTPSLYINGYAVNPMTIAQVAMIMEHLS